MTQPQNPNQPHQQQSFGDIEISGDYNTFNNIQGDNNTLRFFRYEITPSGGVVNILPPEEAPRITAKPTPLQHRPPDFSLVGREAEMQQCVAALQAAQTIELYGAPGIGKSVLLRYLAHHRMTKNLQFFPDGIVYFHVRSHEPLEDFQQRWFEAFYESDRPFKPSAVRIRQGLHDKKALILLDNANLSRHDIEQLQEIAPDCVFLISSPERKLYGAEQSVQVGGISQDAALSLIERDLERSLNAQEQAAAKVLHTSLNGHPLEILQQIAGVRENKEGLADVASRLQKNTSQFTRVETLLQPLNQQQRSVVAAMAALGGVALVARQIGAIAGIQETQSELDRLVKTRLVTLHLVPQQDTRYSLSKNLLQSMPQQELTPYLQQAIPLFTLWVQQANPQELQQNSEALSYLLDWSVQQGRWNDVLTLAKPLEGALAVSGQWERQAQVLQQQLHAAKKLDNRSVIAHVQHQLGTRALCLGYTDAARNLLNQAIQLRMSLGETNQAHTSRSNINQSFDVGGMSQRKQNAAPDSSAPDSFQEAESKKECISPIGSKNSRPTRHQGFDIAGPIKILTSISILTLTGLQIWRSISQPPNVTGEPSTSPSHTPTVSISPSPDVPIPSPTTNPSPSPSLKTSSVPTPSSTPKPSPSPTPILIPSPTPKSSPSPTPVPTPSSTLEPSPSPTPIPIPSPTPEPSSSPTPVPTPSPTPDPNPSPTPIPTPSPTPPPEPRLQLNTPPSLNFGLVQELQPNVKEVWVENIGTAPLSIYPITFEPSNAFKVFLDWDQCSNTTLLPNGKCNISIEFAPGSSGSFQSTLTVASNGGTGSVLLQGQR